MSFLDLSEAFSSEIEAAKESAIDITPVTIIETPLFDIHFKKHTVGSTEIDPTKGFTALNVFSICDKLIVQIATDAITGRATIFGEEAVANNSAPNFLTVFDPEGQLVDEHRVKLKDSDIQRVEHIHASIRAIYATLQALVVAHSKLFPLSRTGIQLAWNSETTKGIYDIKEALTYRINSNSKLRDIKRNVEARKNQRNTINALEYASFSDVLGF